MSNTVNWTNPYAQREGRWLKGNLHTHTSPASPCGRVPLEEMLDGYAEAGYDFLSLSDHNTLTRAQDARLTLLPGIEWNAPGGVTHTGLYACDPAVIDAQCAAEAQPALLAALEATEALVILNHPNWQLISHYRREALLAAGEFDGIEIFNGVITRLQGYEIATDKWDFLLAHGRRVLGFASDDAHILADVGKAWITARCEDNDARAIMAALRAGNFYCSTGVEISDIRVEGTRLVVESTNAQEVQFIGEGGVLLRLARDHSAALDMADYRSPYFRVTLYGVGSTMAWTQPIFSPKS